MRQDQTFLKLVACFVNPCYNEKRKGGRVVEGTGLENRQVNASQVRILSLPPEDWLARVCTIGRLLVRKA